MAYILCADSIIDCTEQFFKENNLQVIEHGMIIDGKEIYDGFGKIIPVSDIYEKLRCGEKITTVLGNIEQMYNAFRTALSNNQDVLYICFSSALSGTYNTACMVANDVLAEMPNGKIFVVDGKCAAAGQGILVRKALEQQKAGKSIEDLATFVENEIKYIHQYAIIDNLEHLKRGGRISKTSALVGSLMGVKPIVHVTPEGALVPFSKARGMSAAFKVLVEKINDDLLEGEEIFVSHADNLAGAEEFKQMILDNTHATVVNIAYLGNTVGCHVGPGGIGLFFKGKDRT